MLHEDYQDQKQIEITHWESHSLSTELSDLTLKNYSQHKYPIVHV